MEEQSNVVGLLAKNEESIGHLYEVYAERLPEYAEFWTELVTEETEHSNWIHELMRKVGDGSVFIAKGRFRGQAIQTFLGYLEREIAKAKTAKISLIESLSTALYIEKSLIERKYFEVFDSDSAELGHLLEDLRSATEWHIQKIEKVWSEHR